MDYQLIRSSRRTLALEVTGDGELLVRSPLRTPLPVIDRFVDEHRTWIEKAMIRQKTRKANHPEPTAEQLEDYRQKAADLLPKRVGFFAEQMGVTPASVRITNAKKRFGSCSANNSLCFSVFLMGYSEELIDYVIVHELSHIIHHDHSKQFWETVKKYMPDYKERRARLRQ